jgi:signal transduction histidine kinase
VSDPLLPADDSAAARPGGSLRLRLMLGAAMWVFLALACAVVVLRGLFVDHVEGQVRARLISDLTQLTAAAEVDAQGTVTISQPLSEPQFRRPLSGLYWQIETLDGKGLLRSRSLWDGMLQVPLPSENDIAQAENGIISSVVPGPGESPLLVVERQILFPDYDKPLRLMVGWDEGQLKTLIDAFTRTLAVSFAVLAVGIVGAAWAQVVFGLVPLRRLRLALRAVGQGNTNRLHGTYPQEVLPLVKDLNAMLGRNERMMTSARETAGNLAHGLKTPLAIIANEAQAMAQRGQTETATLLTQQVDLMRRQVDHHLARARAQAAGETRGLKTPVEPSVQRLVRVMGRLHNCTLRFVPPTAALPLPAFRGDAQTLEEILGNILENACKWAATTVRVSLSTDDAQSLRLCVEDDGPGIPEDRVADVLRRGKRLDESKPGSGLGLAIVDDLTRAVGGSLTLDRSADLGGLRVLLILPGEL